MAFLRKPDKVNNYISFNSQVVNASDISHDLKVTSSVLYWGVYKICTLLKNNTKSLEYSEEFLRFLLALGEV
jgi:hypothetical protein